MQESLEKMASVDAVMIVIVGNAANQVAAQFKYDNASVYSGALFRLNPLSVACNPDCEATYNHKKTGNRHRVIDPNK